MQTRETAGSSGTTRDPGGGLGQEDPGGRGGGRPWATNGESVRDVPAGDVDGDGDGGRRDGVESRRGGERGDDRWDRRRCEASVRRGRGCRDSCRRNVGSLPAPEKGDQPRRVNFDCDLVYAEIAATVCPSPQTLVSR